MEGPRRRGRVRQWPKVALVSTAMPTADLPTGEQIRRAREARRMTQEQLARELGVGTRSIGRWERGEAVPRSALGAIRQLLDLEDNRDDAQAGPRLADASDGELLAEVARRMTAASKGQPHRPLTGRYIWRKEDLPNAPVLPDPNEIPQAGVTDP